jgi:hypothetical protein
VKKTSFWERDNKKIKNKNKKGEIAKQLEGHISYLR